MPYGHVARRRAAPASGVDGWTVDDAVVPGDDWPDAVKAGVVPAPPVYDPGGPVLFVTEMTSAACLPVAEEAEARLLGSPVVVVDQPPSAPGVAAALAAAGYRRHCDFFTGTAGALG